MTNALPTLSSLQFTLHPDASVVTLRCPAGSRASIEVQAGRLWLTRAGFAEDWFVSAGDRFVVDGPAQLYAGADGQEPLRLRWSRTGKCADMRLVGAAATAPAPTTPGLGGHPVEAGVVINAA